MIDEYSFGHMVVDGKAYDRDLIVTRAGVRPDWWRKKGHEVTAADIQQILEDPPEVLVLGTGYSGLVKVLPDARKALEQAGVDLIAEDSRKAVKTYNSMAQDREVVAAFHLTC